MELGGVLRGDEMERYELDQNFDIIVKAPCCAKRCLISRLSWREALELVRGCFEEVQHRSPSSKRTYILNKLKHFSSHFSRKGYCSLDYVVGVSPNRVLTNVCKVCFQNCYRYEKSTVNYLIKALKNNLSISYKPFTNDDLTRIKDHTFFKEILLLMKNEHQTELSYEELAMLQIPNSSGAMLCYSWMKYFFNLVGDNVPNSAQIHLEPQTIYEIYAEYYATVTHSLNKLNLKYFYKLWKLCWPHVKIRRYKAVCGKCNECALFCNLRQQCKSEKARVYIGALHSYHRITYMGERRCYHERIMQSHTSPDQYLSAVSDTMAQNHMLLPWLGNLAQPKVCLPQKMTAVLCHNRCFIGYRFFHNVGGGANASIYCMLRTLERIKEQEGKLPETFYYQVDGGSENSNLATLGMCELLIARRVVDKIVITRLMVGHTHCDIDAFFGVIWKKIRDSTILTPQQYEEAIKDALKDVGIPIIIEDVFVVPDYQAYINPHLLDISQAFKLKYTKLQWIFEYIGFCEGCGLATRPLCEKCAEFPNGVKVTYRAYSADKIWEFSKNADGNLNVQPEMVLVTTEPQARPEYNVPEGMFVLQSLPDSARMLQPAPFITGGRQLLDLTADRILREYQHFGPDVLPHWTKFLTLSPENDIASDFVERNQERFHVPLHNELFSSTAIDLSYTASRTVKKRNAEQVPTMRTTGSVKWPNRGNNMPLPTSTREYIDGRSGDPDMITLDNCDSHQANYMNWTVTNLRNKCKSLNVPSTGNKQVLIDRINVCVLKSCDLRVIKGYSKDRKIYIQLAETCINDFILHLKALESPDSVAVTSDQSAKIRQWIVTEASLKFFVKHVNCFYDMCQSDGTCTWQLPDVMKYRGEHILAERDNCLKVAVINYADKDIKTKLLSQVNEWITHVKSLPIDADIIQHFMKKAKAYINFISCFTRSKKCSVGIKVSDWLHGDALPLIADKNYPFSVFSLDDPSNANDDYLSLQCITNIDVMLGRQFKYDMLKTACLNPNFACVHDGHSYPLPSAESYIERLHESIESIIEILLGLGITNIINFNVSNSNMSKQRTAEASKVDLRSDSSGNEQDIVEVESETERSTQRVGNTLSKSNAISNRLKASNRNTYHHIKTGESTLNGDCHGEESELSDIDSPNPVKGKMQKSSIRGKVQSSDEEEYNISESRNRSRGDERKPRSLRRGKVRVARVKGETKRREMENVLDGALDYSLIQNSELLVHRQVADKWNNKDGAEECFYGEVVSFNAKTKKYLVKFKTGDENPVPWEYSASEILKVILD